MKADNFKDDPIEIFEEYNKKYDAGAFRGSEANKFDLKAIRYWISIRDNYRLVTDPETPGEWKQLKIVEGWGTKYGTNYIYIDEKQHIWRIRKNADEFYGKDHEEITF